MVMALITKTANCGTMADWFKKQGRYYSYTSTPKPGDIVFFDWNGKHTTRHHVGIVKKVYNGGESILTIEGNTAVGNESNGGQVMERTRYRSQIVGYGRPAYADDAQRDAFLARAQSEVGIKESPMNSNKVKYNTWFYGSVVSGSAYPWCAAFVCWVYLAAADITKDNSNDIKVFQSWLNTNYKTGLRVDGGYGPLTRAAAVTAWQMEMNTQFDLELEVDGVYGKKSKAAAKKCEVAYGAKGKFTHLIQGLLYCHGYDPNGFDGVFANGMLTAVRAFQRAKGLSLDGVVGANTWAKLLSI